MMILLFLLYALAIGFAWKGERRWATLVIAVTLVLFLVWFKHHVTDPLAITL